MKEKFDSDYTEEEYNNQDRAELEEFNLSVERKKTIEAWLCNVYNNDYFTEEQKFEQLEKEITCLEEEFVRLLKKSHKKSKDKSLSENDFDCQEGMQELINFDTEIDKIFGDKFAGDKRV
jgi:hypothetical protein